MSYPYGRPGGRRSSAGVIVGCVVGLVVAALVVGVAFVVVRSRGVEPGSTTANPTAFNPTATARPTEQQTITSDHYWADVLGGEFHIESTSVVQGPTDQDGAARACSIVCVSVFCLKGLMHDE